MPNTLTLADGTDFSLKKLAPFLLPGLILALVLRIWLLAAMPNAIYNSDTETLITPAEDFALRGDFHVHSKRTFLGTALYAIPLILRLPALPVIAFMQQAFCIGMVFLTGFLAALWLKQWRWWIIPLTCIAAVHPTLLIYSHTALPDALYAITVVAFCVAASCYRQVPSTKMLFWLLVSLFLLIGARQEGRYYCVMAIIIVACTRIPNRLLYFRALGAVIVLSIIGFKLTQTQQSGQMLLTSLLHKMPAKFSSEPGLEIPLQDTFEYVTKTFTLYPDKHNSTRKRVGKDIKQYLDDLKATDPKRASQSLDEVAKKAGIEIALHNPFELPRVALLKFSASHNELPSAPLGLVEKGERHVSWLEREEDVKTVRQMTRLYFGQEMDKPEEYRAGVSRIYDVDIFEKLAAWEKSFHDIAYGLRFNGFSDQNQSVPGLPMLYAAALLGWVLLSIRDRSFSSPAMLIGITLIGVGILVFGAANHRARYRIAYEIYWWLFTFGLLDVIVTWVRQRFGNGKQASLERVQ